MPESSGLWSPESLPNRDAHDSAVYDLASALAARLSTVTLEGDSADVAAVRDAQAMLAERLGPPEPFVEPDIFKVEKLDATDWLVTCPHCDNGFVLHGPTWVEGGTPEEGSRSTRVCPYCAVESYVTDKRPQWQRQRR